MPRRVVLVIRLLTLFRSLLLGIWYGLSDVQLAQFGIEDQVQRKGYRNKPLSCADQIRNQVIAVTLFRCRAAICYLQASLWVSENEVHGIS